MLLDAGADINAMVSPCCTDSALWVFTASRLFYISALHSLTFPMVLFFLSNQDIKSGQSPLMHAVESNNADMVHFLIEVMKLCG